MPLSRQGGRKYTNPNERGAQGRTPLHRAAREGRLQVMNELIAQGADIHLGDETGEQALQMAARKGQLECVECLIKAGADVNFCPPKPQTDFSETALCSAVRKSYHQDCVPIVAALLHAGADPNISGGSKTLPIHAAVTSGQPELVRMLIAAGARLDEPNGFGKLPLHCALSYEKDNFAIVQLLLENGANVNATDSAGRTPLFYALFSSDRFLPQFKLLLAARPDLTIPDPEWQMTPLKYAIEEGQKTVSRLLREAGAPEPPKELDDDLTITVEVDLADLESLPEGDEEDTEISDDDVAVAAKTEGEEDDSPKTLPEDFDWRNSDPHIHYLAYLRKPKPPYYENWVNISGESGQDAVARLVRVGALALCDTTTRGSFKYTTSDLKKMITKAGGRPKEKKADLVGQALQLARAVFEEGIKNIEMYEITTLGANAVTAFRVKRAEELRREGKNVPVFWLRDFNDGAK